MKIEDVLAPWEYDEATPPEVVSGGELVCDGIPIRFILFNFNDPTAGARLAFRVGDDDGSWTAQEKVSSNARFNSPEQNIVSAWQSGAIERVFAFSSTDDERLFIEPNGIGHWRGRYDQPVYFGLGRRISKMKSSQTRDWIETLLARPNSDVAFSRKFRHLDLPKLWELTFGFAETGKFREALSAMEWLCVRVIRSEVELWRVYSKVRWHLPLWGVHRPFSFCLAEADGKPIEPTLYFVAWAKVLEKHGPLHPNDTNTHTCLRQWLQSSYALPISQVPESPNFHEQLEARLELRAWAKAHLPPDVRAELERLES